MNLYLPLLPMPPERLPWLLDAIHHALDDHSLPPQRYRFLEELAGRLEWQILDVQKMRGAAL